MMDLENVCLQEVSHKYMCNLLTSSYKIKPILLFVVNNCPGPVIVACRRSCLQDVRAVIFEHNVIQILPLYVVL